MKYTDSHCHLDFKEFDLNRVKVISQCLALKINNIIVPAIGPNNWQAVLQLCKKHSASDFLLHPCLGIHPWFLKDLTNDDLQELAKIVTKNNEQLCAIGEAGIDGVIAKEQNNLAKQIQFFDFQLNLAIEHNLPIIVHHRRSHNEVIERLKKHKPSRAGIIHAFSGSYQQAKTYLDLGFKLGIGGTITYPRAAKTIKAIKRLPLDCLILETDAPAMPLFNQQGQANSPINIIEIFNILCDLRSESKEVISQTIEDNVNQLFCFRV